MIGGLDWIDRTGMLISNESPYVGYGDMLVQWRDTEARRWKSIETRVEDNSLRYPGEALCVTLAGEAQISIPTYSGRATRLVDRSDSNELQGDRLSENSDFNGPQVKVHARSFSEDYPSYDKGGTEMMAYTN